MIKNKWRLACGIAILSLLVVSIAGFYLIMDQGVTITYMQDGYTQTQNDLNTLIELINETDLTKPEIENALKHHKLFAYMDFQQDTILLERVNLIFEGDTLKKIDKQW